MGGLRLGEDLIDAEALTLVQGQKRRSQDVEIIEEIVLIGIQQAGRTMLLDAFDGQGHLTREVLRGDGRSHGAMYAGYILRRKWIPTYAG